MATLDSADIDKQANDHPLWAQRGHAIEAYANVEQTLCALMAQFGKMEGLVAGTIFFKIANARARLQIVEDLMKHAIGNPYPEFWKTAAKLIRGLDGERNEIVHWHTRVDVYMNDSGGRFTDLSLGPPNFWARSTAAHSLDSMKAFVEKYEFASRLLNMYGSLVAGQLSGDVEKTWREICQQPVVYPPPHSHPLFRS